MKLFGYWRSSAAYRVRIALALKGIAYQAVPVSLPAHEQASPGYTALNPQALVPLLIDDAGNRISQSLAIIDYLDETHPAVPLLPADPAGRARVRAFALAIACDTHPLNNLRVLEYLQGPLAVGDKARLAWIRHWLGTGLSALETTLAGAPQPHAFAFGATPSLAECCLIPQLYNARRFGADLAPYPRLRAIEEAALALPAFDAARPERQTDAPPDVRISP